MLGVARLLGRSEDGADPFVSLCRMGLRLERGLSELIMESPTLGLRAPSFMIGAYHGPGDQERWALAWGHLIIQSATPF